MKTFNNGGILGDDQCYMATRNRQDEMIQNYRLNNYYVQDLGCAQKLSTHNPSILYRNGYGSVGRDGALVGKDSFFKTNPCSLTHWGNKQTLNTRLFTSIPFKGRGLGDPCMEREIVEGNDTSCKKQCNTLAEVSIPNVFTPLIPFLARNVQKDTHLIPEVNRGDWIRGGCPSRQAVRDKLNKNCKKCPELYKKTCPCF